MEGGNRCSLVFKRQLSPFPEENCASNLEDSNVSPVPALGPLQIRGEPSEPQDPEELPAAELASDSEDES